MPDICVGGKALIPEGVASDIIRGVRHKSLAMQLLHRLPNMTSATQRQPVLASLPSADFVQGCGGMKMVTQVGWENKFLVAAEIATIIPLCDTLLQDASYDVWGEIRPLAEEAIGATFDQQVFGGGNPKAPPEWPKGIIPGAVAAGNVVTVGDNGNLALDLNAAMTDVEDEGYEVNGIAAKRMLKGRLRGLADALGNPIYTPLTDAMPGTLFGLPVHFAGPCVFGEGQDAEDTIAIVGDFNLGVYAVRTDITYEIFKSGVISDENGKVIFNLVQQDKQVA
jgi:HK97 family phage major capsid protein